MSIVRMLIHIRQGKGGKDRDPFDNTGNLRAKTSCAWLCPRCGGTMMLIDKLTSQQIHGYLLSWSALMTLLSRHPSTIAPACSGRHSRRVSRSSGTSPSNTKIHPQETRTKLLATVTTLADSKPDSLRRRSRPTPETQADSIPIGCRVRRKRGRLTSNVSIQSDPAL